MADPTPAALYLDLLKRAVLNQPGLANELRIAYLRQCLAEGTQPDEAVLHDIEHRQPEAFAALRAARLNGRFDPPGRRPGYGHTMIGRKRLDDLEACLDIVERDRIPGDLLEAGVWRGGAGLFMQGYLTVHGIAGRALWLADSFAGLPRRMVGGETIDPDLTRALAIPAAAVREAFERFGLPGERVHFLEGWFADTLPSAPVERLALLRLDGDLFESTLVALDALYPRLAPGGFVIVDDYRALPDCALAVDTYRARQAITAPLETVDWTCVRWRKPA